MKTSIALLSSRFFYWPYFLACHWSFFKAEDRFFPIRPNDVMITLRISAFMGGVADIIFVALIAGAYFGLQAWWLLVIPALPVVTAYVSAALARIAADRMLSQFQHTRK